MDGLPILPLAITMMAGPQIMSAVIFVTTPRAGRVSLGFLSGVAIAATAGTALMYGIAGIFDHGGLGDPSDGGSAGRIVQYVLVALLVVMALKNWFTRATVEPPAWLRTLMSADPRKAFTVGLLVILLMPSDIVVMLTVGFHLQQAGANFAEALPFIALTVLIAALPLLLRTLFRKRADQSMDRVREWMNTHSWLINIAVCALFIVLLLA